MLIFRNDRERAIVFRKIKSRFNSVIIRGKSWKMIGNQAVSKQKFKLLYLEEWHHLFHVGK